MDLSFFNPVIDFFNFIGSLLSTIIEGITGISSILGSIINLLLSITRILPSPLYPCFMTFMSVFSAILIFKLFRKG